MIGDAIQISRELGVLGSIPSFFTDVRVGNRSRRLAECVPCILVLHEFLNGGVTSRGSMGFGDMLWASTGALPG
jgi:hypothetical protein